jgi:O-antigen ligase
VPGFWQGLSDASRSIGVLVVAAAWAIAWAFGAIRFERRQIWWLAGLGAIAASLLVSSLLADNPAAELLGGMGTRMGAVYWSALLVVAAGASAAKLDSRLRWWIAGIYVWAVPAALFGIAQVLMRQLVTAGLLNDNLFAMAMLLVFPPAIGLALTTRRPAERAAWFAVAAVIAVAIATCGARAAAVALLAEAGLALALLAPLVAPARVKLLRGAGFGITGLAAAAVAAFVAFGAIGPTATPLPVTGVLGDTFTARAYIWAGAVRTFLESPLAGHGPDGYQFASQPFIQPGLMAIERGGAIVNTTPADPHSLPLRLLVGMGILGALAVGFAVWGWSVAIRRADTPSAGAGALRASFGVATGGFMIAALFAPWSLTLGALPAVIIGLAAAGYGRDEKFGEIPLVLRWSAAAIAIVIFVGLAVSVAGQSATFSEAVGAGSASQRQTALERSRSWAPYSFETRFQVLWSLGDTVSIGAGDAAAFHKAVDADALVSGYAPALAEFVRQSLLDAERTNRKDLRWERAAIDRASALAPGVPDVVAERLHLALVSGDKPAIAAALQDAQTIPEKSVPAFIGPTRFRSPDYDSYISAAQAALLAK